MATLGYAQAAIAGTNPSLAAASAGGDKIAPNDRGALMVRNGGGSSVTVTLAWPGNSKYGPANPDPTVTVPAGADRFIGPLGSDLADPLDGLVAITYSGVTSVTVGGVTI